MIQGRYPLIASLPVFSRARLYIPAIWHEAVPANAIFGKYG